MYEKISTNAEIFIFNTPEKSSHKTVCHLEIVVKFL